MIEAFQPLDVDLHDNAILAGHAVALAHLRHLSRDLDELRQLARHGADPHEGRDRVAERSWIELQPIPRDDARFFQSRNALAHRRRRHADPARQLRDAHPRARGQQPEEVDVPSVEQQARSLNAQSQLSFSI